MTNVDDLEKLAALKKKGVITAKEFEQQKEALLCQTQFGNKSEAIYLVLAFFLGGLGIHNFYAGYVGRGVAQLLITLLLGWLIIPLVAVWIWVFVEICTVRKGATGQDFIPTPTLRLVIIVLSVMPLFGLLSLCGMMGIMATSDMVTAGVAGA